MSHGFESRRGYYEARTAILVTETMNLFADRISVLSVRLVAKDWTAEGPDIGSNPIHSTKCSYRIVVSSIGFQPINRGSIPLGSTRLGTKQYGTR